MDIPSVLFAPTGTTFPIQNLIRTQPGNDIRPGGARNCSNFFRLNKHRKMLWGTFRWIRF